MGDSITNYWSLPTSNLGVAGNTTTEMLGRFPSEVPNRGYKAIVILGGTNDVRVTTAPIEDQVALAIRNIEAMAEMSEKDGLLVVVCTIPPIQNTPVDDPRVVAMNTAILALAQQHQYKLVDYYTPMVGHPEYFHDDLHPSSLGYLVMQSALVKVLPLNY